MVWNSIKQTVFYSYFHPRYLVLRELRRLVSLEAFTLQGKLLDVGCGRKPYIDLFRHVDLYIGIDIPTTMHGMEQVDVVASAHMLPFKEATFDSILCTEVLEHCWEPALVLQEMKRVCKPKGYLLLTAPLSEQLHEEPFDYYRFTIHGLIYLLEKTGWLVQRVYTRGGVWLELGYRFSSALYTVVGAKRETSGRLRPRLFLGPIVIVICAFVQFIASVLDKLMPGSISTEGYCIVARRPE